MMPRLTFATRVGLIFVLSLMIAWIGSITLFYAFTPREAKSARPLPGKITALVQALESAAPADRPFILRAVASQVFTARIEPGVNIDKTPLYRVPRVTARVVRRYLQAVGGRPLSVTQPAINGKASLLSRFSRVTPVDLQFRIGLKTQETLIIDARSRPVTSRLGLPIGFIAGLLGTLCGLAALIVLHRETQPLTRLAAAVDRMDLSAAAAPLPQAGSSAPEIRALIAAFNRLQGRLSQLLRVRMAMLGGISHDVRSFATRLRLRVDQIPEGVERDRAIADISDMIRLLDDALLASRAGAGELAEELVEVDQVIRAEVEDRHAVGAPVTLTTAAAGENALVLGDRLALRRVAANLIDNALKYGKSAQVSVQAAASTLILIVDDEGPGIPPEQREAMLEPFVRLETSRNRRTGGAGLGLAVVCNLVEAHSGSIVIDVAPGGGARFMVRLPLFRA